MSDLCVLCDRKVSSRQHAVSCDGCERWQHRLCDTGISRDDYLKMTKGKLDLQFLCTNCRPSMSSTMIQTSVASTPERGMITFALDLSMGEEPPSVTSVPDESVSVAQTSAPSTPGLGVTFALSLNMEDTQDTTDESANVAPAPRAPFDVTRHEPANASTLDEGTCKEAVYLPKAAKEFLKDVDKKDVLAKIRQTIEKLESIKLNQETTMSSLEADRGQCLKQINDHHKELLHLMDKIIASSKDKIETTFQRYSTNLQRHHQEVNKYLVDWEESEIRLKRNQGNDVQLFVDIKKYQKQSKKIKEVSSVSLDNLKIGGFNVAVDNRLHDMLVELDSMATVLKRGSVQVKKKYKIHISTKKDEIKLCNVFGVCVLNDGSVIVSDTSNDKLKHIDTCSRNIISQYAMPAKPNAVCCINHNEVAVTLSNNTVAFVSVKPCLTPNRTISMDHHCIYIAYSQEQLFINDQKHTLYIYDMAGSLLRKIGTDPSGRKLFSKVRHVVLNDEGDKLYVADADKGILTTDIQGKVLDKLVSDQIQEYWGVCLDGTGGFFVCGFTSNNVIQVGTDGQILAEVLLSSDGLGTPTSVCFDKVRKRLIVSQYNSNQLQVCNLE